MILCVKISQQSTRLCAFFFIFIVLFLLYQNTNRVSIFFFLFPSLSLSLFSLSLLFPLASTLSHLASCMSICEAAFPISHTHAYMCLWRDTEQLCEWNICDADINLDAKIWQPRAAYFRSTLVVFCCHLFFIYACG